jgi:hypothetical protein
MSTPIAVLVFSLLTVLAAVGVFFTVDKDDRWPAMQIFAGWTAGTWAMVGFFYLLGWWTP